MEIIIEWQESMSNQIEGGTFKDIFVIFIEVK